MVSRLLLIFTMTFSLISYAAPIKIGLLLDDLRTERWQNDRNYFVAKAKRLGAKVYVKSANGDANKQVAQIENMIARKVDVLVIIPTNSDSLSSAITSARAADIKVLAYDRLITNTIIDLYVSFDNVLVGEMQANEVLKVKPKGRYFLLGGAESDNNAHLFRKGQMNILQPAIDRGDIQLAGSAWVKNWSREEAFIVMSEQLKKQNDIDAVVASNDGTADGAVMALSKVGKIVPISGQDAEIGALRRIVKGLQTMTVYKSIKSLAETGAELAIQLAKGVHISTNGTLDNGMTKVPAKLLAPILVTKGNIDTTVIADGYHSKRDIYK